MVLGQEERKAIGQMAHFHDKFDEKLIATAFNSDVRAMSLIKKAINTMTVEEKLTKKAFDHLLEIGAGKLRSVSMPRETANLASHMSDPILKIFEQAKFIRSELVKIEQQLR